ncbi:hypothetical protein KAM643c_11710 [Aeromonas caviae]|nr:hypothetical protein KAM643c_11710 [Aeromonas caviae]
MMATNMASICCRAANRVWGRGDILDAVDQFAVGSLGGMGLSDGAWGGSLFHKYLECVGGGEKIGRYFSDWYRAFQR